MKITVVADVLGQENNGTTTTIKRMIKGLVERGHEVTVVSPMKDDESKNPKYITVRTRDFGIFNGYLAKNGVELGRPEKDKILEVAAIATDLKLNEIARYEAVIKVNEDLIKTRMVGEFWEKNKTSRDALIEQNETGRPVEEIERELLKFLADNFSSKEIYLAGNSIHQDRKFIERELPELNKKLHYRMLDVSAWKIYFEQALNKKFTKPENHRALDDITGSIEELKWYLTFLK